MTEQRRAELERQYQILKSGRAPLSALATFRQANGLGEDPDLLALLARDDQAVVEPPVPPGVVDLLRPGQFHERVKEVSRRRKRRRAPQFASVAPSAVIEARWDVQKDLGL
jgi:hypothetical protein